MKQSTHLLFVFNLLVILFFSFFLMGCDESSTSYYELAAEDVNRVSSDSMLILVDRPGSSVHFKGSIDLIEGACEVFLQSPVADTLFQSDTTYLEAGSTSMADTLVTIDTLLIYRLAYHEVFETSNSFSIDERFDRLEGNWKLGCRLFRKEDGVLPLASYQFQVSYSN